MHRLASEALRRARDRKDVLDAAARGSTEAEVAVLEAAPLGSELRASSWLPPIWPPQKSLKAHASNELTANQTSNIARGRNNGMADESFTATLHIGPTRHLPAHLQKSDLLKHWHVYPL